MSFFKEFREFALKGNVMDMAVGVIIGGAFGKIVSSLVNDILMPPIGALIGNTDFSSLRLDISKVRDLSSKATHVVTDAIGSGTAESVPAEPIWWNWRIHPTVRGFRYPGLLRLSDGQDDEQADEEKTGSRAGTGAGTVQGGVVAYGDSGPAPGTKKIIRPKADPMRKVRLRSRVGLSVARINLSDIHRENREHHHPQRR